MKRNAIIRIVIFSIALFVLSAVLVAGIIEELYMNDFNFVEAHNVSTDSDVLSSPAYTVDPSRIRNLEIDWAAGSITVVPTDQNTITIEERAASDEYYPMIVNEKGNQLTIEYCEDDVRFIGINKNDEEKHLVIYVPKDWECYSLEIDAASAGVDVSNLVIREMEFDGASGVCHFTNCQIEKLDIDTASGDVIFTGALEELDFDAMSACFRGTLSNVPSRLDMDTMSGDLDIALPESSGFTLNLDAMSGDFSSDFATSMRDEAYVCGDGTCRIHVSAMSGDVAIRKHQHQHTDSCYTENSTCPDYTTSHHEDKHH